MHIIHIYYFTPGHLHKKSLKLWTLPKLITEELTSVNNIAVLNMTFYFDLFTEQVEQVLCESLGDECQLLCTGVTTTDTILLWGGGLQNATILWRGGGVKISFIWLRGVIIFVVLVYGEILFIILNYLWLYDYSLNRVYKKGG